MTVDADARWGTHERGSVAVLGIVDHKELGSSGALQMESRRPTPSLQSLDFDWDY